MGAAEIMPGVLFSNRALRTPSPALYDVTATILSLLGAEPDADMIGRPVLEGPAGQRSRT